MNLAPKARLLADSEIKSAINTARAALATYGVVYLESADKRFPEAAAIRMRQELLELRNPADIQAKRDLIADHTGADAGEMKQLYTRIALEAFELARHALVSLLERSKAKLEAWEAEAIRAEEEFFSGQGVTVQRTEVSRRYAAALRDVQGLIDTANVPPSNVPHYDGTALQHWFGVSVN